jgi:valyl-tRNA synthetase
MDKKYNHKDHEDKIYENWLKADLFHYKKNKSNEKKFSLVMPPPNANDPLHLGHSMFAGIEDILVRFHRMKQEDVNWFPGADHAGIETQFVFEKKLSKKKQSRFQFDRQTLYQMIFDYVGDNTKIMTNQLKKLGVSCNWDQFKFTLDEEVVKFVNQTFKQLHHDNLIYRDFKLVNYCTKCGTAFSDLEINHQDATTPLYYLKYGPFILATTRPETKFGDTAVAVNPKDKRYQKYIGKEIEVEGLLGKFKLKVIADDYVDMEFGTGVVKITPFHDHNDYEIYLRHKNEMPAPKQIIDFTGKLNENAGPYQGLKIKNAREIIVQDLEKKGLIAKIEENYHNKLSVCYRCKNVIEPLPLPQFFIKVKPLIEPIIKKINSKKIKVHGKGYDKILLHWLNNLKDWNITRQIAWGIKLPIVYNIKNNPDILITFIDRKKNRIEGKIKTLLEKYNLEEIKSGLQELRAPIDASYLVKEKANENELSSTSCLDTWFSSSLWPLIHGCDLKKLDYQKDFLEQVNKNLTYYPQDVMETGYDILPFWVMRMLMLGYYLTKQIPFENIYLHGLIRDKKGLKMSKSKGNVINPLDVIEKYGSDALRFTLVLRSTAGLDKSVADHDFIASRNFTNKIWNATRFLDFQINDSENKNDLKTINFSKLKENDLKTLEKINQIINQTTKNLDNYKIGLTADILYNEFWHWFCDILISEFREEKLSLNVLIKTHQIFIKLLHPFLPFLTTTIFDEINKSLENEKENLIISTWPNEIEIKKNK